MKTQIKNLIENNNVRIVVGCVIIFNGILHLAFGAAFISSGSPFSSATLKSILASNQGVKAVSGFTIVSGLFLMLFPVFIYWNLSKNLKNIIISQISWFMSCLLVLFDFTSGVLTAQVYAPTQKYTNAANISISSYGTSINNTVNFALADCILTFILGLPCTLFLLTVSNTHREKVAKIVEDDESNASQASGEPKRQLQSRKEEESEVVHHDLAIGVVGGYNPSNQYPMNNGNFGNQPHPFQVNMDYEPPSPQSAYNNQINQVRYESISPSFNQRNSLQYSEPGLHHVQSQ